MSLIIQGFVSTSFPKDNHFIPSRQCAIQNEGGDCLRKCKKTDLNCKDCVNLFFSQKLTHFLSMKII